MKFCYDNPLKELKDIVQTKAKYQKVMLVYDENVSNVQISEIYEAIKEFCIYNQSHILNIDENEIYNGYRLIIYFCGGDSFLNCSINRDEFINVFFPQDDCLLPYFLNQNCLIEKNEDFMIVDNSKIDLQMLVSANFNSFYNYFKNLLCGQKKVVNLNLYNNSITHYEVINCVNMMDDKSFFIDIDILKKCEIEYKNIVFVDLLIIDAIILLITSIKSENFMLVDVYKTAKDDNEMVDKFFKLYNNENFFNIIKLNYNCLYNFSLKTKQRILEFVSFFELDLKKIDVLIEKIKKYSKQDNDILAYLYLYNIFNA